MRRPQELGVGHARQHEIVGVPRLAGDLGPRVDLGQWLADDRELVLRHRLAPAMRTEASSTASRIFVYPVHRQRLPASAALIWSRVGVGVSSSNAWAVRRIPGVQ